MQSTLNELIFTKPARYSLRSNLDSNKRDYLVDCRTLIHSNDDKLDFTKAIILLNGDSDF